MTSTIKIASTPEELNQVLQIRKDVFVDEQRVPIEIEIDEFEDESVYFLLSVADEPAAVGRVRQSGNWAKFERIATIPSQRGKGLGASLMNRMVEYVRTEMPSLLPFMHSQASAIGFYEKLGWVGVGSRFVEADIEHLSMILPSASEAERESLQVWKTGQTTGGEDGLTDEYVDEFTAQVLEVLAQPDMP